MIIDYGKNADHATRFSVFDRKTGEKIDYLSIFFADDQAGIIRRYKRRPDTDAIEQHVDGTPVEIEERREIDIVRKA